MKIYTKNLIIPKFESVFQDVLNHGHTDYSFPGGRGGTKSSAIGIMIPLLIAMNPNVNALCLRRRANTIANSVFAEIQTGISRLGLDEYFRYKTSPHEFTYKPTGQKILFRGLDDPQKIKSIKIPNGYIGITWLEELAEYPGRTTLRSVLQSTGRGGDKFWTFESYNPPITSAAWVNVDLAQQSSNPRRLITWSNYLDVPRHWLGDKFIEDAEDLKRVDELAYRHEYLGEAVGTGGNVFQRIKTINMSDTFISKLDRIYQGQDWGYYPDPNAFIRLHYDAPRRTVYFIDEHKAHREQNDQLAHWIKSKHYHMTRTVCDSAEQKSVGDLSRLGVTAVGCFKRAGWPEYGIKWLAGKTLVFDTRRTPHAYKEFVSYEFDRDKDGNIISGFPDRDNHFVDASRYALESLIRSSTTAA